MSKNLSKKEIDKFSRQIILKKHRGPLGQKKILDFKGFNNWDGWSRMSSG